MARFATISFINYLKYVRNNYARMQNAESEDYDGSMIKHWEKVTGCDLSRRKWTCPMCGESFDRDNLDGAHVVFPDGENNPQYITPMCQGCNRGHDDSTFEVHVDHLVPAP